LKITYNFIPVLCPEIIVRVSFLTGEGTGSGLDPDHMIIEESEKESVESPSVEVGFSCEIRVGDPRTDTEL